MLGPLEKKEIKNEEAAQEEKEKIFLNEEKNTLYGNFYLTETQMSEFYQNCLDLKSDMDLSDKKSEEAKARDYKQHNANFKELLF